MKKFLSILIFGLLLAACSNSIDPSDSVTGTISVAQEHEETGVNILTSPIVSDPVYDPYSVENMSKAMRNRILAKRAADTADVEQMSLAPNYLYVRFLADGKRGAAELKKYDTSLVLFKHPLDYKHIRKPVVYIDPTLPDSIIPLFATVPVDYKFGPTKYEVIKELFLVEPLDGDCEEDECVEEADSAATERALLKKTARNSSGSMLEKLADMGISLHEVQWESMSMTGYIEEQAKSRKREIGEQPTAAWSILGGGKKHGGILKFKDDILGVQPLEGVRVTGGYSYYWREAHTDAEGKFKIPEKWNFDIDYEANFDADDFLLEDGHSDYGEDLEIEKNDMSGDWKETFTGNKAKWCVVWTAAYQYWYGNNFGLKRPWKNTSLNMSLDIVVYYKNESDYKDDVGCGSDSEGCTHATWFVLGDFRIAILAYNRDSRHLYKNTTHELSHASQYSNQKKGDYFNFAPIFKETYATGNSIYFTKERYGDPAVYYVFNGTLYCNYGHIYTGLVADLIDDEISTADGKKYIDNVSGFNIKDIESAFFNSTSITSLKKYIIEKFPSGTNGRKYTSSDMDNLFDYWTSL